MYLKGHSRYSISFLWLLLILKAINIVLLLKSISTDKQIQLHTHTVGGHQYEHHLSSLAVCPSRRQYCLVWNGSNKPFHLPRIYAEQNGFESLQPLGRHKGLPRRSWREKSRKLWAVRLEGGEGTNGEFRACRINVSKQIILNKFEKKKKKN